ncbi:MAG: preQ(1) synthase [Gammaproteobacteria bacterium]|nr:preQ(1) synthase [Gammaproteobacteria bacterium]
MSGPISKNLETFGNPRPGRDYTIQIGIPEFTCLCPLTGQPDFAHLSLVYVPDRLCVELKSLRNYIWGFRDRGAFHEAVSNEIVDDLCTLLNPRFIRLTAQFRMRGGISTRVVVEHRMDNWNGSVADAGADQSARAEQL